ncbi:MAG: hypothetical protein FWC25_00960 [Dehalococcoidia bacterium]|nr:hypothetical protein [Dehalococcoidia bacterium]
MLLGNHFSGDYVHIGFWQIVIILIIACGILLVARNSGRGTAKSTSKKAPVHRLGPASTEEVAIKPTRKKRLRWLGIALIVIGLIALGIILSTIIDLVYILSAVAGIIILSGIVVIILSTRR